MNSRGEPRGGREGSLTPRWAPPPMPEEPKPPFSAIWDPNKASRIRMSLLMLDDYGDDTLQQLQTGTRSSHNGNGVSVFQRSMLSATPIPSRGWEIGNS